MGNLFGKLLIDEWYKMIAFAGFVLVILSLTVELQVDNPLVLFCGTAIFFVGVAEMAMRQYQEQIAIDSLNRPAFKVSGRARRPSPAGMVMYLLAAIATVAAITRAWVLIGQA